MLKAARDSQGNGWLGLLAQGAGDRRAFD